MFFAQKKRATLAASLSALKFPRSALRSLLSVALSSAAFKSTLYDTSFSSYCQYFTCGYLPFWCGYFSVSLRLFLRARAALAPVFTSCISIFQFLIINILSHLLTTVKQIICFKHTTRLNKKDAFLFSASHYPRHTVQNRPFPEIR